MEFLNPAALYTFLLLPLLLLAYLIRGRPRRMVFSSLLFLRDFSTRSTERRWRMIRLPPIFFLQLLLLVLLILALGEPVFSVRPLQVAIVLDNSASMQAREGQWSRFELAQQQARNLMGKLSARARIDVYQTVPRIERVGEKGLGSAEARSLLSSLRPYDMGDPPVDVEAEIPRLKKEMHYEQIYLLTDHPVQGRSDAVRVITVGRPQDNLAITSFYLSRPALVASRLEARVEVTNFFTKDASVELSLKAGERMLAARTLKIGPRRRIETAFEGLPAYPYYQADLAVRDGLALDNRRFAVAPTLRGLKLLGISPRPEALLSLRSVPGLSVKVIPPGDYAKIGVEDHAVEIFHFSAPSMLPQSHALLILPPAQNPLVAVGRALTRPVVSDWREPHALTRYINFALFRPTYARPLRPLSLIGETILESPEGALAIAIEHQGFRYLVLGFDPFPYLGSENLPVSIFTLNMLQWFQEAGGSGGTATGEFLPLNTQRGGILVTPQGEELSFREGPQLFSRTYFQGVYQVLRDQGREYRAVNYQHAKESDLNHPAPISFPEHGDAGASGDLFSTLRPYLLLLSVLLLLLEWFLNPPASRSAADRRGKPARASSTR